MSHVIYGPVSESAYPGKKKERKTPTINQLDKSLTKLQRTLDKIWPIDTRSLDKLTSLIYDAESLMHEFESFLFDLQKRIDELK